MSSPLSSNNYVNLDETTEKSDLSTATTNCSVITRAPTGSDVLICGTCSSRYSDLKLFIDHKQNCNPTTFPCPPSSSRAVEGDNDTIRTPVVTSPMVSPTTSAASIVNFPIGVPHVIVQSSGGVPQMYRLLLEPSSNGTGISSSMPSSSSNPDINVQDLRPADTNSYGTISVDSNSNTTLHLKQENFSQEPCKYPGGMMPTFESPWPPDQRIFDALQTEEEDVATFLASQLVNQAAPAAAKLKDSKPFDEAQAQISIANTKDKCEVVREEQKYAECVESQIKVPNSYQPSIDLERTTKIPNKDLSPFKKKKLQCKYDSCLFSTFHHKDMVRHVRKHTGEKPYPCTVCGKHFSRQDKLKVHLRIHTKERPYSCTYEGCSYSAIEKAHLNKHIRIHTNDRPYKCQMCRYAARNGSQLTVHLRSHTGDAPFHCQMDGCSRTFKTSSDLRRHEKLHTGEKPYKCTECDYAAAIKSNLKVHCNINHMKDLRFVCKICSFSGVNRKQLKDHEKTHPNTAREGSLKMRPRTKPSCIKNFKCDLCGSAFVREDSYRSHMRQHQRSSSTAMFQRQLAQTNLIKFKNKPENIVNYVLQGDTSKDPKSLIPAIPTPVENISSYVITIDGLSASLYPDTGNIIHDHIPKPVEPKDPVIGTSSTLTDLS